MRGNSFMQAICHKIAELPLIKQLNRFNFMPIIWWTILVAILPYIFSLLSIPVIWRVGVLFLIVNSIISLHLGHLIIKKKLSFWWIFLLPIVFALVMLPKFANYNLIFGIIYLIFELFGLINKSIYR